VRFYEIAARPFFDDGVLAHPAGLVGRERAGLCGDAEPPQAADEGTGFVDFVRTLLADEGGVASGNLPMRSLAGTGGCVGRVEGRGSPDKPRLPARP
jgi:hypothetical protein